MPPPRPVEDPLPPFNSLTTDEEREKKAELHQPGTYHVITNPRSFESLPEYRDTSTSASESGRTTLPFREPRGREDLNTSGRDDDNPNIVILKTFEDMPRRASVQSTYRHAAQPSSPLLLSSPLLEHHTARRHSASDDPHHAAQLVGHGSRDEILLEHYRRTISPQILRRELFEGEEDIFILHARTYPPVGSLRCSANTCLQFQAFSCSVGSCTVGTRRRSNSRRTRTLSESHSGTPNNCPILPRFFLRWRASYSLHLVVIRDHGGVSWWFEYGPASWQSAAPHYPPSTSSK